MINFLKKLFAKKDAPEIKSEPADDFNVVSMHPNQIENNPAPDVHAQAIAGRLAHLYRAKDAGDGRSTEIDQGIAEHRAQLTAAGYDEPENANEADFLVAILGA